MGLSPAFSVATPIQLCAEVFCRGWLIESGEARSIPFSTQQSNGSAQQIWAVPGMRAAALVEYDVDL